jgi:hypothetical protein
LPNKVFGDFHSGIGTATITVLAIPKVPKKMCRKNLTLFEKKISAGFLVNFASFEL